jgi:hypothetical protein
MRPSTKSFLLYLSASMVLIPAWAFSAQVTLLTDNFAMSKGQVFSVELMVDTESESVNAIEGEVLFSSDIFEVQEIRDGNSIITFWVERPNSAKQGRISFSGIIPGGYRGNSARVFTIILKAKENGRGEVRMENLTVFMNNDSNASVQLSSPLITFVIAPNNTASAAPSRIIDTIAPETFRADIVRSQDFFDGRAFLVFAAQDKGTGIDRYEVREGFLGSYSVAESPYLLADQRLDEKVYVKAIDKNGNIQISIVYPAGWRPWYKEYGIALLIIVFSLSLGAVYFERRKPL